MLDHGGDGVPEIFTPTASVCEYTKAPGATGTPCSSNNDCSSPTCFGLGVAFRCVQGTCSCQGRTPPTTTSKAIITAAPTVTSSWPFTSDACFNSAISNYGGNFGAWCSVYGMSNLAVMPCTSVHDIHAMTDCFSSKTAGGPVYTVPYADKMEQACVTDSHQYSNAYQYLSSACYHANNYFVTRGPYTGDIN